MLLSELVSRIANILMDFDSERPVHGTFQPGIGPFTETKLVGAIAERLRAQEIPAQTHRTPDMGIPAEWAVEFKIARPFGDNGKPAEHWSQNLLHPYKGNTTLIGDGLKLMELNGYAQKCLFAIGFEHETPKVTLDPLLASFELVGRSIMGIPLGQRVEERRGGLVHPEHQVVRCVAWALSGPNA